MKTIILFFSLIFVASSSSAIELDSLTIYGTSNNQQTVLMSNFKQGVKQTLAENHKINRLQQSMVENYWITQVQNQLQGQAKISIKAINSDVSIDLSDCELLAESIGNMPQPSIEEQLVIAFVDADQQKPLLCLTKA